MIQDLISEDMVYNNGHETMTLNGGSIYLITFKSQDYWKGKMVLLKIQISLLLGKGSLARWTKVLEPAFIHLHASATGLVTLLTDWNAWEAFRLDRHESRGLMHPCPMNPTILNPIVTDAWP